MLLKSSLCNLQILTVRKFHKKKTLNLRKRKQSDSPSQVKPPRGKKMKFTKEVAAKQQEEVKDDMKAQGGKKKRD